MYLHNAYKPIRQIPQVKCNREGMVTVATGMTGMTGIHRVITQTGHTIDPVGPLPLYQPLSVKGDGDGAKTVRCDFSTSAPLPAPPVNSSSLNSHDISRFPLLPAHEYNAVFSAHISGYAVKV